MSNREKFVAHRCEGSVKNYISIRKYEPNGFKYQWPEPNRWALLLNEFDYDYDSHYQSVKCYIDYCPFCGERLDQLCLLWVIFTAVHVA